jgi:hypothetical protein
VIPFEAFHIAQIQETQAKAPIAVVVCQPHQSTGHLGVVSYELALVAVARLTDAKRLARHSFTRDIIETSMQPYLARHF